MVIPSRIVEIGKLIPEGSFVADVGADHGLLESYLIANKNNIFVLAIENKRGPYKTLFSNLNAIKNVRLSLSDGLTAVDSSIDTIVLAGMGGFNIIDILAKYPKKVKKVNRIIVDAHRDIDAVRKAVVSYGFDIEAEKIVYEGEKYYVLISFVKASNPRVYTEDEYLFGSKIIDDPLWPKYRESLIEEYNRIIENLKLSSNQDKRIEVLLQTKERLVKYGKN